MSNDGDSCKIVPLHRRLQERKSPKDDKGFFSRLYNNVYDTIFNEDIVLNDRIEENESFEIIDASSLSSTSNDLTTHKSSSCCNTDVTGQESSLGPVFVLKQTRIRDGDDKISNSNQVPTLVSMARNLFKVPELIAEEKALEEQQKSLIKIAPCRQKRCCINDDENPGCLQTNSNKEQDANDEGSVVVFPKLRKRSDAIQDGGSFNEINVIKPKTISVSSMFSKIRESQYEDSDGDSDHQESSRLSIHSDLQSVIVTVTNSASVSNGDINDSDITENSEEEEIPFAKRRNTVIDLDMIREKTKAMAEKPPKKDQNLFETVSIMEHVETDGKYASDCSALDMVNYMDKQVMTADNAVQTSIFNLLQAESESFIAKSAISVYQGTPINEDQIQPIIAPNILHRSRPRPPKTNKAVPKMFADMKTFLAEDLADHLQAQEPKDTCPDLCPTCPFHEDIMDDGFEDDYFNKSAKDHQDISQDKLGQSLFEIVSLFILSSFVLAMLVAAVLAAYSNIMKVIAESNEPS